jgi:hypothetical protein
MRQIAVLVELKLNGDGWRLLPNGDLVVYEGEREAPLAHFKSWKLVKFVEPVKRAIGVKFAAESAASCGGGVGRSGCPPVNPKTKENTR